MPVFEFSIIATGLDPQAHDFERRFFEKGADDATVSFQRGLIILDFAREASDIDSALASAIDAVQAAGARITRIEPDPLVSLADIAARAKLTRAAVSLYASGQRGRDFPPPVARVTSDGPLWDWAEVAMWLVAAGRLAPEVCTQAYAIADANKDLAASQSAIAMAQWAIAE